jgi:hypothetical protein
MADIDFTHGGKFGNYAKWMSQKIKEEEERQSKKEAA